MLSITGCGKNKLDSNNEDNIDDSKIICKMADESHKIDGNVPKNNFEYGDAYLCELNENDKNHLFYVLDVEDEYVYLIDYMNLRTGKVDEYGESIATPQKQ